MLGKFSVAEPWSGWFEVAWRDSFSALVHRARSVTFTWQRSTQENAAQSCPLVKQRRAYLWSSRAGSINISASLAFNYTIIDCLGSSVRSSNRARISFSSKAHEGIILTLSRLTSYEWSVVGYYRLLRNHPFRSNKTCVSSRDWTEKSLRREWWDKYALILK